MSGRANGRFLKLAGFVIIVLGIIVFLAVHHNVRSQLSDAQRQLQELQNDNQDLLLKVRDTRDAKNFIEMEKTKLTNQLLQSRSDHSKALDDMHKDVKELKDRHDREISDSKESIKQANDELSQCKDKRQQLEMENEKHVTILKTDLNAAKYQLDDCNKSRSDLHNRLSELQAVIRKSKTLFESMKKEVEDYKATAGSLKTKSDNMNKQILTLKSQLESCRSSSAESKVMTKTPTTVSGVQNKDSSVNTTKDTLHKKVKNTEDDDNGDNEDNSDDEDEGNDGNRSDDGAIDDGIDGLEDLKRIFDKDTKEQAEVMADSCPSHGPRHQLMKMRPRPTALETVQTDTNSN